MFYRPASGCSTVHSGVQGPALTYPRLSSAYVIPPSPTNTSPALSRSSIPLYKKSMVSRWFTPFWIPSDHEEFSPPASCAQHAFCGARARRVERRAGSATHAKHASHWPLRNSLSLLTLRVRVPQKRPLGTLSCNTKVLRIRIFADFTDCRHDLQKWVAAERNSRRPLDQYFPNLIILRVRLIKNESSCRVQSRNFDLGRSSEWLNTPFLQRYTLPEMFWNECAGMKFSTFWDKILRKC